MAMEDVGTTCVSMSIISPIIGLDFGFAIWCGVSSRCGAYTELVKNAPKPLTPLNKWKVPKNRRKQQTTRKHNREGTVREGSDIVATYARDVYDDNVRTQWPRRCVNTPGPGRNL